MGRHLATVHLNGEDVSILCIAPVKQDTHKYRIMYLEIKNSSDNGPVSTAQTGLSIREP